MLHRADASMIWNSFLFDKNYKWLSYNVWFLYIQFYKVMFFFDFTINNNDKLLNYYNNKNFLNLKKKKNFKITSVTPRFCYYIDLYCIEFFNQLILLNLYFLTNLDFYKNKDSQEDESIEDQLIWDDDDNYSIIEPFDRSELDENSEFLYHTFF